MNRSHVFMTLIVVVGTLACQGLSAAEPAPRTPVRIRAAGGGSLSSTPATTATPSPRVLLPGPIPAMYANVAVPEGQAALLRRGFEGQAAPVAVPVAPVDMPVEGLVLAPLPRLHNIFGHVASTYPGAVTTTMLLPQLLARSFGWPDDVRNQINFISAACAFLLATGNKDVRDILAKFRTNPRAALADVRAAVAKLANAVVPAEPVRQNIFAKDIHPLLVAWGKLVNHKVGQYAVPVSSLAALFIPQSPMVKALGLLSIVGMIAAHKKGLGRFAKARPQKAAPAAPLRQGFEEQAAAAAAAVIPSAPAAEAELD